MSSHPCRIRNRNQLLASLYHNTPLSRGVIAALDDGLNRHNPCPCPSCQTQTTKRSSSTSLDSPPSKRLRTRSPSSPISPIIYYCRWCSFPHHSPRLSCPECGRRNAPPPMAQHFRHTAATPLKRPIPYFKPHSLFQPHCTTPPSVQHTDPSQPLPPQVQVSVSEPNPLYVTPAQSEHLQYHSPQSTIPDPTEFTDYDTISTPPSPSMASKSINRLDKHECSIHNHHSHTNHDINDAFMEDVSKEGTDHPNTLRAVDSARFSLGSEFSHVSAESVVELGGVDNHDSKHIEHKSLSQQNDADADADIFLNDIIMSEKEKDPNTCNDISDLHLTFLEGMFPSIHEHDAC